MNLKPKPRTKTELRRKWKADNQKERRQERVGKGLCIDSCQFPALPGSSRCAIHKAKRASSSNAAYLAKRLKRAGLAQHEYDLRMQLTKGKCEGCRNRPATHFNFEKGTDKLRGIVCKRDNQILALMDKEIGGLVNLMGLAGMLASFYIRPEMSAMAVDTRFFNEVGRFMAQLLEEERLNAPDSTQPTLSSPVPQLQA